MKIFKQFKDKQMKDEKFAKEYEAVQPELDVVRAQTDKSVHLKEMYAEELQKEIIEYAGETITKDEVDRLVNECINRMEFSLPTMHRNMKTYAVCLVDEYRKDTSE